MVEIRKYPLPHELSYYLDCASENMAITAAADLTLRLYADSDRLDAIGNDARPFDHRQAREMLEYGYERYAAEILRELPPLRRYALVRRGYLSLVHYAEWDSAWLCESFYEDMTRGGMMWSYRTPERLRRDQTPTPKTARRLRARDRIMSYIRNEGELERRRVAMFEVIAAIPVESFPDDVVAAEDERIFAELDGQHNEAARQMRKAIEDERFREILEAGALEFSDLVPASVPIRLKPAAQKKLRERKRQYRKVAKRAAVIAAAVLGAGTVSAFASGKTVEIPAGEVTFLVKKTTDIVHSGHGAVNVGIADAAGPIASLCVFQEMPALDQLVSIALHARAGHTSDIATIGNFYAIKQQDHPFIVAHRRPNEPEPVEIGDFAIFAPGRAGRFIGDREEKFKKHMAAYRDEMLPVFRAAVMQEIFGKAGQVWLKSKS